MSDPHDVHHGSIPSSYLDIVEKRSIGHIATISPSGWPHVNPVWVDHEDGEYLLVNTLRGRQKDTNLQRDPRAMVSIADPDNPYRYLTVRGRAQLTEEGADAHIDTLANKYLDLQRYPHHDEEEESRVIVRIPAEHVITRGRSEER